MTLDIRINGELLSTAEAMTIRVAVSSFLMSLQADGLGDDETGKALCDGYQRACQSVLGKMQLAAEQKKTRRFEGGSKAGGV
jgi:hypothetical protein